MSDCIRISHDVFDSWLKFMRELERAVAHEVCGIDWKIQYPVAEDSKT